MTQDKPKMTVETKMIHPSKQNRTMNTTRAKYLGIELKVFAIIGIVGSIVGVVVAPVELLGKLAIGYGAMAIVCASFMLGAWDTWKELRDDALPMAKLRESGQENPRNYIDAILVNLEGQQVGNEIYVNITISFVSRLLVKIKVTRMLGQLSITDCEAKQTIEFVEDRFGEIYELQKTNHITKKVELSEAIRKSLSPMKRMKLSLTLEREGGNPIVFDPPDDDPLKLSMPIWRVINDAR